ncbi:hypothetical protein NBRC116494_30190 [Aurantivibrio plasticivorans]
MKTLNKITVTALFFIFYSTISLASTDEDTSKEEAWLLEQAALLHSEFESQGLLYTEPGYEEFLNASITTLAGNNSTLTEPANIYIIRSVKTDTFSLPNGNIYLTSGLIAAMENIEDLLSLVAHEFGHLQYGHFVKAFLNGKSKIVDAHTKDLFTLGLSRAYAEANASISSFSLDQELEADRFAIRLLESANYSASSLLNALTKINKSPALSYGNSAIFGTHSISKRIRELSVNESSHRNSNITGSKTNAQLEIASKYGRLQKAIFKDNIEAQIRERLYFLTIKQLDSISSDNHELGNLNYYYAECYKGLYEYPQVAANNNFRHTRAADRLGHDFYAEAIAKRDIHFDKAIEHYQLTLSSSPIVTNAYKKLGELYEQSGDNLKAINNYEMYLKNSKNALDYKRFEIKLSRLMSK